MRLREVTGRAEVTLRLAGSVLVLGGGRGARRRPVTGAVRRRTAIGPIMDGSRGDEPAVIASPAIHEEPMPALPLGYKASAEQFPPQRLLDLAVAAERRRLRLGLDQRPLPALAPHDGHAPNALVWLGRRVAGDEAGHARHVRAHAVVPLQPRDRGPGVRDARLPRPGSGDPRRRDRRVDERGPGRRRLARAERALRPAQGGRDADPGAHRAGRRDRRLRGHVLPDPRGDGLRQAGPAGADLHRRVRTGRRAARGPDRGRLHLHLGQGRGAVHRDAPAGARRGRREGRPRRVDDGPDDRDEGLVRHRAWTRRWRTPRSGRRSR